MILESFLPNIKENNIKENNNAVSQKSANKSTRKSIPPTIEEVAQYCLERKNRVIAEEFIDFYSSKDWYVGKNKMTDWQAAVRTWERKNKKAISKKEYVGEELPFD